MADYIKRQALKHGSALIASAGQIVPVHKSIAHTAIAVPGAQTKVEQAIVDAQLVSGSTTRVQARLGSVAWLGTCYLRVSLAAAGAAIAPAAANATFPYCGFNIIKSMRVLCGSEVLAEHTNYRAALKAWLRYMSAAQAESILYAMGGSAGVTNAATTVIVPLICPWGLTDGETTVAPGFVPLHGIKSNISFEITFNDIRAVMTQPSLANLPANGITACSLVYYEASFADGETLDHTVPVARLFRDFQSFAPVKAGGAVTDQSNDLSSAVGMLEAVHVFATSNVTQVVGMTVAGGGLDGPTQGDFCTGTHVVISRAQLDGREYMRVGSASDQECSYDLAIQGFGRVHFDGTLGSDHAPVLPFALHPRADGYSGGLPTAEMRVLQVLVSTGADCCYEMCTVGAAELAVENGNLVRKRM